MKKEPSIHITRSQFEKILSQLEIEDFPVEIFFVSARKVAINSRAVVVSNNKNTKQVSNLLLASRGDAALVADILYATRIKLKHRGVKKINVSNSREWTLCKKVAEVCNIFCNDFQLETREGFIKYIEIGISRMSDNRNILPRLISMSDNITAQYESELEILQDDNKEMVQAIHDYFVRQVADTTGVLETFEKTPERYIHFLRLKNFLRDRNWDFRIFLDAQFESLAWCNGLPDISQLYTDKAIERYNKYLYRTKGKQLDNTEHLIKGSLWDKIK